MADLHLFWALKAGCLMVGDFRLDLVARRIFEPFRDRELLVAFFSRFLFRSCAALGVESNRACCQMMNFSCSFK